jgi:uncharacterized protein YdaU (DUF1376 family)
MAALPYMPLYVADYLADAAHLSTLQHGAYMLLIMNYWQRGEPLPADDSRLAKIARVGTREWAKMKPVISEFFTVGCSNWSHSRIDTELARVSAKSLKCKKAGQASVQRRFGERSTDVEPTDTDTSKTLAKEANADSDTQFWEAAKAFLKSERGNSGSLIGKWCRDYGKPETAAAITRAQLERPAQRIPFIEGVLRKQAKTYDRDRITV